MKRFFYATLFVVAVSGIIVAQKTSTSGSIDASSKTSAQKQGRQVDLLAETQLAAQLQSALDTRHAKVGDQVIFKTTEAIKQNGKVVVPKGEPSNFLTEAELRAKFAGLTEAMLGAERAAKLADAVLAIDTTTDVASLMRLASPLMPARLAGE